MTDGLAYLAAVALAFVFAYSAAMKLRDNQPTRRALKAAGLSPAIASALPAVEIFAALALLIRPAIGAIVALTILGAFTAFVAYLIARNIDVSCGCFGANATEPASIVDVARNLMLAVLAVTGLTAHAPTTFALEEVIFASTAIAIGAVLLSAMSARKKLGQLFNNQLPGGV